MNKQEEGLAFATAARKDAQHASHDAWTRRELKKISRSLEDISNNIEAMNPNELEDALKIASRVVVTGNVVSFHVFDPEIIDAVRALVNDEASPWGEISGHGQLGERRYARL